MHTPGVCAGEVTFELAVTQELRTTDHRISREPCEELPGIGGQTVVTESPNGSNGSLGDYRSRAQLTPELLAALNDWSARVTARPKPDPDENTGIHTDSEVPISQRGTAGASGTAHYTEAVGLPQIEV